MKTQSSESPSKRNALSIVGSILFCVVMFIILYSFNKHSLYSEAEFESQNAVIDHIESKSEDEIVIYWDDLKEISKKIDYIDPEYNRFLFADSAAEVTFVYEYNLKRYQVVSIIEKPSSDSSINTDWDFWKVESVKEIN